MKDFTPLTAQLFSIFGTYAVWGITEAGYVMLAWSAILLIAILWK